MINCKNCNKQFASPAKEPRAWSNDLMPGMYCGECPDCMTSLQVVKNDSGGWRSATEDETRRAGQKGKANRLISMASRGEVEFTGFSIFGGETKVLIHIPTLQQNDSFIADREDMDRVSDIIERKKASD